jgi:hypothetical protein
VSTAEPWRRWFEVRDNFERHLETKEWGLWRGAAVLPSSMWTWATLMWGMLGSPPWLSIVHSYSTFLLILVYR